jgi:hypothetical protein
VSSEPAQRSIFTRLFVGLFSLPRKKKPKVTDQVVPLCSVRAIYASTNKITLDQEHFTLFFSILFMILQENERVTKMKKRHKTIK